jgi:hopanoid biosynthesis associated RND transporter like protein HpnN
MQALIARIVATCAWNRWVVIAVAVIAGAGALAYAARHFAIDTDPTHLIAEDVAWRQREVALDAAFPHRTDLIAVVVDAPTPELAELATTALTEALSAEVPRHFREVWRPDGGAFFAREGILFGSVDDVAHTTAALIAAQPMLGPMAADPSVRGVMDAVSRVVDGAQADPAQFDALASPLSRLADTLESVLAGQSPSFSWRELFDGRAPDRRELRRFVLVQPVLDYRALEPGEKATKAIREKAHGLGLDADSRIRVRLTGPTPLADEEFATLADGAALNGALMLGAVLVLLWAALHSWRVIVPIVASLAIGLAVTAAFGLFAFGTFNLISVAFAALFVGLGVDFGIQFCVCYRAHRHAGGDLHRALRDAGGDIGPSLALAATSIAAGFYAFLPTEYRGVSALGAIAGTGMIVAFVGSITVLPAMLALTRPPGEPQPIGYAALAPFDRFLLKHRRAVLTVAALIAAGSVLVLPRLTFDFNPLHLRRAEVESVSTLLDLMRDPDTTPNTIDVLAPTLQEAKALAERLERLPEVDHALTLASFVPSQQDEKLALIGDAALLLDPVIHPAEVRPPPDDGEIKRAMQRAAQALAHAATSRPGGGGAASAKRLAEALSTLAQGDPALRVQARTTLVPGLTALLGQVRSVMQARRVAVDQLPTELRRDWISTDGRARVEVFPRAGGNDNAALAAFATAVRTVAPDATGAPVSIQESSRTIVRAFVEAGSWALAAIILLLAVALRRARDVLVTLAPLLLSGVATLGLCAAVGIPLDFENIIALPLLVGIGVAFNIYFVMAWRAGRRDLLQSSLARAVIFSALTTGTAFGSLWLSHHPGTAGMGRLLALSLAFTLASTLTFLPALLGSLDTRD